MAVLLGEGGRQGWKGERGGRAEREGGERWRNEGLGIGGRLCKEMVEVSFFKCPAAVMVVVNLLTFCLVICEQSEHS